MKHEIKGLLEIHEHRGLKGDSAVFAWMIHAMTLLLRAELARIEQANTDQK